MIFLRLDLRAFGPFSNLSLDFSSRPQALHVIYGPNEAGKSTTLRAVRGLLYGIPAKTSDDHLHKPADLRVGARLGNADEILEIVRRKGLKNTLLGPDGTPIDDVGLRRLLGGVGAQQFDAMFGLDHQTLRDGGEALLQTGGELGESLFDAALGGAMLHHTLEELRAQASELFTPQAHTKLLNKALRDFDETKKSIKQAQLDPGAYTNQEKELGVCVVERDALRRQIPALEVELHRLMRATKAHRYLGPRARAVEARAALGSVAPVGVGAVAEREKAERWLDDVRRQQAKLRAQLDVQEKALAALPEIEPLLASSSELETLRERLGSHKKAQDDLPGRRAELRTKRAEIESLAAKLGAARPQVRLDIAAQTRLHSLGTRHASLREAVQRASEEARQRRQRRQIKTEELAALPPVRHTGALEAALRAVESRGDLSERFGELERQIAGCEERARLVLSSLGISALSVERAAALSVPSPHEAREMAAEAARVLDDMRALGVRRDELDSRRAAMESALDVLRLQGAVPSEDDLGIARARRDALADQALAGALGDGELLRRAIREADSVADRLRREAQSVAERARLEAERRTLLAASARLDERGQELTRVTDAGRRALGQRWSAFPGPAPSAAAMVGVAERLAELPSLVETWSEHRRRLHSLTEERGLLVAGLVSALGLEAATGPQQLELGGPATHSSEAGSRSKPARTSRSRPATAAGSEKRSLELGLQPSPSGARELGLQPSPSASPDGLLNVEAWPIAAPNRPPSPHELGALRLLAGDAVRTEELRQRLKDAFTVEDESLLVAEAQQRMGQEAYDEWARAWAAEMARLGLPATTSVDEATAVVGVLRDLWTAEDVAASLHQRIAAMEDDAVVFAADVAERCRVLAPELAGFEAVAATDELVARLTDARQIAGRRHELVQAVEKLKGEIEVAAADAATAGGRLESLCAAAGAADLPSLLELEMRASLAAKLEADIAEADARIEEAGDGMSLGELDALFAERDVDQLAQRLDALRAELESARERSGELDGKIGAYEEALRIMQTHSNAADRAADAQGHLARARHHAERWVRLRLAAALLSRQLERHRERNQGPVLRRAGTLFARLTAGMYQSLRASLDEHDRAVLACVRANGDEVGVPALSDGTRDQLYLALRLASLEQQARPLPLVVDDVFVHFDDDRARRGLELLAEYARGSQVLFFTHHARLVELAETLPDDGRVIHRLSSRGETERMPIELGQLLEGD